MGETRAYLWQGIALSFIVEFAGGFVAVVIGLARYWLKERRTKLDAQSYAARQAEVRSKIRAEMAASQQRNLEMQNRMLRAGIDPDTGQPLPHFANGNAVS